MFAIALLIGVTAPFARKNHRAACLDDQLYIKVGSAYQAVFIGEYYCTYTPSQICTYYRSSAVPLVYTLCEYGIYNASSLK